MGVNSDINVTPMIDVMLVLLVVFMLSVQLRSVLPVNVPPPADHASGPTRAPSQVVLELKDDGSYAINGAATPMSDLATRLRDLTDGGNRKLIFVRAAARRPYGEVVRAVDIAKGAGWEIIGYMP